MNRRLRRAATAALAVTAAMATTPTTASEFRYHTPAEIALKDFATDRAGLARMQTRWHDTMTASLGWVSLETLGQTNSIHHGPTTSIRQCMTRRSTR